MLSLLVIMLTIQDKALLNAIRLLGSFDGGLGL